MRFASFPRRNALGVMLAYPVAGLKKGQQIGHKEMRVLEEAGVKTITGAKLAEGDIDENTAAKKLAEAAAGKNISLRIARGGRVNLHAEKAGLLVYEEAKLVRANRVHEACTLAVLPPYARLKAGERAGSVKIIPLGVADTKLAQACRHADNILTLHPFRPMRAILIHTSLPHLKPSLRAKAEKITKARLEAVGGTLTASHVCPHETDALAEMLRQCGKTDMVLIHPAQAIIDRSDVVPAALKEAGGRIIHFGMPVEPGNLLLLGEYQKIPVIGLPGCARSPKRNGLDWIIERLAAKLPLGSKEIAGMGAGGLLP